ncbi:MAG: aminofutalosine synthase MqnE [Bacteroidota bacterium]|nr:aminofutalosine synthase MqnE [Bacteroidota bacterium]
MINPDVQQTINLFNIPEPIAAIAQKVVAGERISTEEGLALYEKADLSLLGTLASVVRERLNGNDAYFNKNFHIEPTNICIYRCKFCSYSRKVNEDGSWESCLDEIAATAQSYKGKDVTEVHIVGGVHPQRDLYYYADMVRRVRTELPDIHIKAFSAVEIEYMFKKTGVTANKGFEILKEAGLNSIPGGGAEIFDETLRAEICPDKVGSEGWLAIHEAAHQSGILSNATMLYGHIETYAHRIDHMNRLRKLQDKTKGFNCFIPLKYRKANNPMSDIGEVSVIEDLRNYAVSRIFLDNFPHLKAYWPMSGKEIAQLALSFGVDDLDGTIDDTTKIYTMAGAEEQKPSLTTAELSNLIRQAKRTPVERDSWYRKVRLY